MCLAYPMKVVDIKADGAIVDADGIRKKINIGLMKDLQVGEYVMVHAGFAIEKFKPEMVKDTLRYVREYKNALRKISKK
ncbi:MAG: HypC/HybG/HupF family hydrogenase formation chaperone [Candidatus Omnitrophota bacterium]